MSGWFGVVLCSLSKEEASSFVEAAHPAATVVYQLAVSSCLCHSCQKGSATNEVVVKKGKGECDVAN